MDTKRIGSAIKGFAMFALWVCGTKAVRCIQTFLANQFLHGQPYYRHAGLQGCHATRNVSQVVTPQPAQTGNGDTTSCTNREW